MDALSAATALVAFKAAGTQQAIQTALARQQAKSMQAVVQLIDGATQASRSTAPAGQGTLVDRRV